jgi:hypothetical protein
MKVNDARNYSSKSKKLTVFATFFDDLTGHDASNEQ